jgi:CubicO group peptidase (beta-lactamase class C family)
MKNIIPILFIIFPIYFIIGQNKTLKYVDVSSEKIEYLKKELHEYVDNGKLAGIQTAILRKGELVLFDTYGYSNIQEKQLLNEQSIFRIFSMTKPITSVGLMMLYDEGKFELEDPVYKYIPEFKNMTVYDTINGIIPAKKTITILDLLRHSSGISYGRSPNDELNNLYSQANLRHSTNLKEFSIKLAKLPLLFEPGTAYEYGYSTDLCGYLIEVLSGKNLDMFIQERVLNPLQMTDTHFQLPKEKIGQLTTGYRVDENDALQIAELPSESRFLNDLTLINGGGGLVSTTNDYLNFCRMLINNGKFKGQQLLKPETLKLMTQDHLISVRKFTPRLRLLPGETGFGLGFSIASKNQGLHGVYGWGGAVGTYFRIDPEQELAYIMMIQLSPYRQLHLRARFQELVNNIVIN